MKKILKILHKIVMFILYVICQPIISVVCFVYAIIFGILKIMYPDLDIEGWLEDQVDKYKRMMIIKERERKRNDYISTKNGVLYENVILKRLQDHRLELNASPSFYIDSQDVYVSFYINNKEYRGFLTNQDIKFYIEKERSGQLESGLDIVYYPYYDNPFIVIQRT